MEARNYTQASALHVESAEQETQARIDDLDAYGSGNRRLAAIYERRFRPEFQEVFAAWTA